MRAVPVPLSPYTFVDIGAGKGAAVLLASEFPFKHHVGIDLYGHLLDVARENVRKYVQVTGRKLEPEWVESDIMQWDIPRDPALYFMNDPFPHDLSVRVVERLASSLREAPRQSLLVYRKPAPPVCDALRKSDIWRPLKVTPYWRIYASPSVA